MIETLMFSPIEVFNHLKIALILYPLSG